MLTLFAAIVLTSPADGQRTAPADPQRVKAAVAELQKAYKDGEAKDRIQAIERASAVVDAQVVEWVARGLRDQVEVQRSAIEALRWMDHPDALKQLEETARRDKRLQKEAALYAGLLRAIGQHASASSIEILTEELWEVRDHAVIQARILSLGRIRTPAAVEALIGLMKVAGPMKIQPFMDDFRLSLMVLTGADQDTSQELWLHWWNDNKGKLKVEPTAPPLPRLLQLKWDYYWGKEMRKERAPRRGERGRDDPEKGGSKG